MELEEKNINVSEDKDFDVIAALEGLNNELREYLEKAEKSLEIPRKVNGLINQTVNSFLMEMVKEYKPESGCCFLVKNVSPESNVCFVHKINESERTFENIELSAIPPETKVGDVLVIQDGKYAISLVVTAEVLKIRQRIIRSLENSIEEFQVEGVNYVVCDKSDDIKEARMSLKIEDSGKEFWGIDIDEELYEKIEYGSKVKYENGRYILA